MSWSMQSFWKPRLGICMRLPPLHFMPKAGIRSDQIQEEVKHVLPLNNESYNRIVAMCKTPHSWVEAHRMFVSGTLLLQWLTWNILWSKVLFTQLYLTLWDPRDYSPPCSSVHGILQARVLEWVAISSSRGSFWPRGQTWVSCIAGRFFIVWATREAWMHVCLPLYVV